MTVGFNWWRESESDRPSMQDIVDRVQATWRVENQRIQATGAPRSATGTAGSGSPHEAPDRAIGVAEAHLIMQRHRECRADECPHKAAARQVLITAGRMKPDTSREY